jgi:hypothetical protein
VVRRHVRPISLRPVAFHYQHHHHHYYYVKGRNLRGSSPPINLQLSISENVRVASQPQYTHPDRVISSRKEATRGPTGRRISPNREKPIKVPFEEVPSGAPTPHHDRRSALRHLFEQSTTADGQIMTPVSYRTQHLVRSRAKDGHCMVHCLARAGPCC